MLRKIVNKLLHSTSHSQGRKRYSSSAKNYGRRYSSSHGYSRRKGSSSDYKRRHGNQGHGYYKTEEAAQANHLTSYSPLPPSTCFVLRDFYPFTES